MNFIQYLMTQLGLLFLYSVVLYPVVRIMEALDVAGYRRVALAIQVASIVWVVISLWVSYQTAKKMTFENMSLKKATIATFHDARLLLSFVPGIRGLFRSHTEDKDDDTKT